jgi:hypothetical protein
MSAQASPPPTNISTPDEDLPAVMCREPPPLIDQRRQRVAEPQTISKRAAHGADVGDDLVPAAFHHHRDRAVSVHLAGALRLEIRRLDNVGIPCPEGTSADGQPPTQPHE